MDEGPTKGNKSIQGRCFPGQIQETSMGCTSFTIIAHLSKDGLMHIHPDRTQNRNITPRENARLQSFPDKYIFEEPGTKQYIQIGNAFPPMFTKAIAESIKKAIEIKVPARS